MEKKLKALENRIGYEFRNRNLLILALTHSSYANEKKLGKAGCNERLELIRTQRTAGRTVTEDLARIDREKRRLAQAGIDAFWQALAQLGYDRAQALELLQQNLRQAKEEM